MMSVVREFHNVLSKYTDFVLKDISQKYQLDYQEMSERYISKCSRSLRQRTTNVQPSKKTSTTKT